MLHPNLESLAEWIRNNRLLDDAQFEYIFAQPEAEAGDAIALIDKARGLEYLTPYQAESLKASRYNDLTLGHYRLLEPIEDTPRGRGFIARHPSMKERVLVRLVRPEWIGPKQNAIEYVAQAQGASLVNHRHIATVLDASMHNDQPFVVQEFFDGAELDALVNEMGAMPFSLACEYIRQAALGLQAAHEKSIIHGNVSPKTMMLYPVKRVSSFDSKFGSVRPKSDATIKVNDLGLSPIRPPFAELTFEYNDSIGLPEFLPPERYTNGDHTIPGDIYGLGASLYYLLSAKPPYTGSNPAEVMLNWANQEPTPIAQLRSDIPPDITELVHQLIARDPGQRPSLAETISRLLPHCEVAAMPSAVAVPAVAMASETNTNLIHGVTAPQGDLMPELAPLEEEFAHGTHAAHEGLSESFGGDKLDTDAPIEAKPRKGMSSRTKLMLILGLVLNLMAIPGWLILFGVINLKGDDTSDTKDTTKTETIKKQDNPKKKNNKKDQT